MKSSKWIFGLVAIMVVLSMAPSSFAQVQLIINNTPASAGEVQTNRNAQTSDPTSTGSGILISGSLLATSPLTTTTLTLAFGAPITSNSALANGNASGIDMPGLDPIRIEGQSGVFASITAVTSIDYPNGNITITLPCWQGPPSPNAAVCGGVNNGASGSFRVVGVRVDVNGKTAPLTVTASLSSSANNYIPPASPTVNTINALGPGIASITQTNVTGTNTGTFLVFTNQVGAAVAKPTATIVLGEGFASAWRMTTQSSTNGAAMVNGTDIRLTFNGVPRGMTITATPASFSSGNRPFVLAASTLAATATTGSPNPTLTIKLGANSLTAVENLQLDLVLSGTPSVTLVAGNITVTATLIPIGDGLTGSRVPVTDTAANGYPRFAQADVGPLTVGTIAVATTNLLIPYAVKVGAYDTGIAIANTSLDPFGASGGGAAAANGTMTFYMYPRTDTGAGTAFSLTTSASARPGVGLDTSGILPAGGTWTGLVTDLMTAAGKTGDFFGYIFITANFTFGHGASYIFDGRGFTSASPVLVLPTPASFGRFSGGEGLNN